MADVNVRAATAADAAAICVIYNQGIEDRLATLETELRTPDERREWLAARGPRHPVIVAVAEPGTFSNRPPTSRAEHAPPAPAIIGWASLNRFNPRPAYDHVADISVYVERAWRGRGVGRRLIEALVTLGREHAYHKLVLAAFPFNAAGMALYERAGFRVVGVYREQGRLDGTWVDVMVMERLL
ncbi:MAG TPA: GNAT family N-acetyltransferase [Methylomirabilota bacterium]|nr:GNAT family N-acetyltransferase [Methylomirabilota bacterium]